MRALLHLFGLIALLLTAHPAAAQKAYVREDLASEVVRLEERIRKEAQPAGARTSADLRRDGAALVSRNPRAGMAPLASAIALAPREAQNWIDYARAARATALTSPNDSWRLNQTAITAAYAAYQRASARNDEAAALNLLGAIQTSQGNHRLALNAWRASLDLVDDRQLRTAYDKLREEHGFRIVDYASTATPRRRARASSSPSRWRADAPISRPLSPFPARPTPRSRPKTSRSASRACATASATPSCSARACPPLSARNCCDAADYEIYVRDRSPQVRFTGTQLRAAARRPGRHAGRLRQHRQGRHRRDARRRSQPSADHPLGGIPLADRRLPRAAASSTRPA